MLQAQPSPHANKLIARNITGVPWLICYEMSQGVSR